MIFKYIILSFIDTDPVSSLGSSRSTYVFFLVSLTPDSRIKKIL